MKKKDNIKPWGGRFSETSSEITERISASIHYDCRLYRHDIEGSIVHARMLNRIGILSEKELGEIETGLRTIEKRISSGEFTFSPALEDIHMNIESALTEMIGDTGRKLHTGRSRNDQIALDVRLYLRDEINVIRGLLSGLIEVLTQLAEKNIDVIIPGYTHLQVAQPVRFSQHVLAYAWKFRRDMKRLDSAESACAQCPLGAGALGGVNYPGDRDYVSRELGFDEPVPNSMDAVSDRDFVLDFLYFSSVLGTHLSRFCEDLVLWSSSEFGFIRLSDRVTTGSSIMPQKRNPDIAELIRGKTGRLYGNLVTLLTILKGLPMTYNRDLQEDKEPLFDSIDTVKLALEGMGEMLSSMQVNRERAAKAVYSNFSTATDIADYLVKKGVPFRKSHEIVGNIVRHCEETGADFFSLSYDELAGFSDLFDTDAVSFLNPEESTERKQTRGSTARNEILEQIRALRDSAV